MSLLNPMPSIVKWIAMTCGGCGVKFCFDQEFYDKRLKDRNSWYCPNGCQRHFTGETEEARLKRIIEQKDREIQWEKNAKESARKRVKGLKISVGKAKAKNERILKRVSCGVCPHCQRTFKQLAAHMKAKHPHADAKS